MARSARLSYWSAVVVITVAACSLWCDAKPEYYVTHDSALDSGPHPATLPGCTDQPQEPYGTHVGILVDTDATLSLTPLPKNGALCKGLMYSLQVDFPSARYALLTAKGAVLGDSNAYTDHWDRNPDTCAGKRLVVQPKLDGLSSFTTTVQVSCAGDATNVVLALTSAGQGNDPFMQLTSTYPIVDCPTVPIDCTAVSAPAARVSPSPAAGSTGGAARGSESEGESEDESESEDDNENEEENESGDDHGSDDDESHDSAENGPTRGAGAQPVTTTNGSTTTGGITSGTNSLSGSTVAGSTVGGSGKKCVAATACQQPSALGYVCSQPGDVTVHYAYSNCVPDNDCTRGAKWTTNNGPPAGPLIHVAAEAKTNGYVSAGFAKRAGSMPSTDAVLGYIDANNNPFLEVFPLSKESIGDPYPNSLSMLTYSSVLKTSDGRTIICFARPLNSTAGFKYSANLDPTDLQLNYAFTQRPALVYHGRNAGGKTINAATGAASESGGGGDTLIYVHAALMVLAWIAFAPLGATLARHRWALGEKKLAGIRVWFQMHRLIQVTAVLTAAVAFIIALTSLDAGDTMIGESHKLLGILVMALAVLQVIIAVPRPKPDSPHRAKWNLAHWWIGRITMAAAITVCYLGIVLFHDNDAEPYARWLVPTIVWLAALLIVEITLSLLKSKHSQPKSSVTATPLPGTPDAGVKGAPSHSPHSGHV